MIIDNQQKIYYNLAFMKLRKWQQKVIDEFPEIIKNYKKNRKKMTKRGEKIKTKKKKKTMCF